MRTLTKGIPNYAVRLFTLVAFMLMSVGMVMAQAQSSTADLSGNVTDPNGARVPGATVSVRKTSTGLSRSTVAGNNGDFQIIGLTPGSYDITAEAPSFKKTVISGVTLTVGQAAQITIKLEIGDASAEVVIEGSDVELVETTRTAIASTIDQRRINNLPINERSATGFALTLSTVGRDNGRPVGPAPTSGLNIGGQRGRSTQVNVDGADFTDNSINAARSTVSMEAVQEYQISTNSYSPEFGRATGGVINVVTKRGTNEFSGNIFGFLRDKSIQSRNAFAPVAKPDFRRTQFGGTLGGPIVKDKTFFFTSFERRQRNESGFFTSNVIGTGSNALTSSVTVGAPFLPFTQTFNRLTAAQATFANTLIGTGNPTNIGAAIQYLYLASSGGNTALSGSNPLLSVGGAITAGTQVGPRFVLSGAPVPFTSANSAGQFIAFRPLLNLDRVFPIKERANYFSVRGDHSINDSNQLSMRFGYNTIFQNGIQVESQNQSLGQNDVSRTGITDITDYSFSSSLNSIINGSMTNEFRFSWGRRETSFRSQNNDAVAFNISGTAFIGRELFSPVDRSENRYQILNNFNLIKGNHTMKFGGDFNWVEIPEALFELNFVGLFNFGDFAASNLGFPVSAPAFTPVQSYGLGLPSTYIQGFGNPISKLKNQPVAVYAQDSWRIHPRLSINYGFRYEWEGTETIAPVGIQDPLSGITMSSADILAAQNAVRVQQGFPRDGNNIAPRFGFAWDMFGNGKTVIRGSAGLYYDHPLLAAAFNSDIADAAQQQQAVLTAGSPSPTSLLNAAQVFQGTVCVPGATPTAFCAAAGSPSTPGVAPTAQYQFGRQRFNDQRFTGFGAVLPFSLPIAKDFQYASATQANLSFERQITKDMSLSLSYLYVGAHHLPHPTDLNAPRTDLQIQNFARFAGRNPISTTEAVALSIPTTGTPCPGGVPLLCFTMATPTGVPVPYATAGQTYALIIPGMIAAPLTNLSNRIVAPAVANFFRPNAPNYFLASALTGGLVNKATLDGALAGSLRTAGILSPFGSVNAQISDGNSTYNALNIELKRRFASNLQFYLTYTWSRSIDDSSDLQTLLIAQDVDNFRAEKADSLFDQRHRFVFSGLYSMPSSWSNGNALQKILSGFTVAPIIELSSGRPFNIITNVDTNNDQSTQTDRPSLTAAGTLCIPGTTGCTPLITNGKFSSGTVGRNMGLLGGYASVDMRISRGFSIGEKGRLEFIAEGFNLFNRFNEASASPFITDVISVDRRTSNGRWRSRSTAAFDARQFQFGAKFSF